MNYTIRSYWKMVTFRMLLLMCLVRQDSTLILPSFQKMRKEEDLESPRDRLEMDSPFLLIDQFVPIGTLEAVISKAIMVKRFVSNSVLFNILTRIMGVDKSIEHVSNKLDSIINERTITIQKRVEKNLIKDEDEEKMKDILSLLVEANSVEKVLNNQELKSNAFIMV